MLFHACMEVSYGFCLHLHMAFREFLVLLIADDVQYNSMLENRYDRNQYFRDDLSCSYHIFAVIYMKNL